MNYQETLDYLYQQLPIFSRVGSVAYKPDIGNITALCEVLGNPHRRFACVHIAGTNGKGSCSHMTASILQAAGYSVGLYTSPHLFDFRERIRINGEMISRDEVVDFVERMKAILPEVQPSFFELTVAMAFDHFARHHVDIAVVEVGLGGLLDSTNIVYPDVSVITNISLDHTQLLGHTVSEIATQKAGIIKAGVPVVIGERTPDTEPVFLAAAEHQHSPLIFAGDEYTVISSSPHRQMVQVDVRDREGNILPLGLDLTGQYQLKNVVTVLSTVRQLRTQGRAISEQALQQGLRSVKASTGFRGRFELLREHPRIVADVAHNEAGISAVLAQVGQLSHRQLLIVMGFVHDKDVDHVLRLFPATARYFFIQAPIPRALPAPELAAKAAALGLQGKAFSLIHDGMAEALGQATPDDLILVTGSFFIMDEVFRFLEKI